MGGHTGIVTRCVLFLAVALCPATSNAQVAFHYEQDWTFTVADRRSGVREVVQIPGKFHLTQIWIWDNPFETQFRASTVVGVAVFLLAISAGGLFLIVRKPERKPDP